MNQRDWEWEDLLQRKAKEREAALKKQAQEAQEKKTDGDKDAIGRFPARPFDESSLDGEDAHTEVRREKPREKEAPKKSTKDTPEKGKPRAVKKKKSYFLIGYLLFVLVLAIIAFFFLRGVTRTMEEMRDNVPEEIVRRQLSSIPDETIAQLFPSNTAYEDPAEALENIRAYLAEEELGVSRADKNLYDIKRGNTTVMQAKLNTLESVSHLGIINYDILEFAGFIPVEGGELYHYELIAPSSFEITVNGRGIGAPVSSKTIEGFGDAGDYVTLPTIDTYELSGLTGEPDIRVIADGRETEVTLSPVIDLTADGAAGVRYETFEEAGIEFDAMGFATQWNLFMTDDLGGDMHGYWQLAPYFIDGTSMQKKAHDWATGIDITLTSFHQPPTLSDERIYDVVRYGEDAASYKVYMKKEMTLDRTGEEKVDIFESTVYLVRVDGEWKVANVRGVAEE